MTREEIELLRKNEVLLDQIDELVQKIRENNDKLYAVHPSTTGDGGISQQKKLAN